MLTRFLLSMIKLAGSEWLPFKLTFKRLIKSNNQKLNQLDTSVHMHKHTPVNTETCTYRSNKIYLDYHSFQFLKKINQTYSLLPNTPLNNTVRTYSLVFNSFPTDSLAWVKTVETLSSWGGRG